MANEKLGFLKGTQAKLDGLTNTQVREGTFYLTTDSHRLYIGLNGQKQLLNKYIHEYASVNSLPATGNHKGDFAYASAENVLAYFNGTKWQQINPDTRIVGVKNSLSSTNGGVNILTSYEDNLNNSITSNLSFVSESEGLTITGDGTTVKFALADFPSYTFNNSNNTFAVSKDKVQIASLKISSGNNNVTIAQKTPGANGEITISAIDTTLSPNSDAVKVVSEASKTGISVRAEDTNNNAVYGKVYLQGTNGNEVSADTANNVLNIKAPDLKAVDGGLQLGGKKVNFVSTHQADGLFKITENETSNTVTFDALPEHVEDVEVVTNAGGYNIGLKWGNASKSTNFKLDPRITYGEKGSATVNFTNEVATLSVYTQKEIDDKITEAFQQQDAMVFKGGVSAKPTGDQENGSTYKVTAPFLTYKTGDIIIASGTESADTGLIPAAQVTWVHVPAGDDEIYSLEFNDSNSSFSLYDGAGSKGSVKISGDNWINVGLTSTGSNGTFAVTHSGSPATETPGTQVTQKFSEAVNLNIITSITTDNTGHISGFTKTPVTFTDTHNYVSGVSSMFDAGTNTLGVSFEYTDGVNPVKNVLPFVKFTSSAEDNLVITPTQDNNMTVLDFSMVWGEF